MAPQTLTPGQRIAEPHDAVHSTPESAHTEDSPAAAFIRTECRKLVRGCVTRWRREELEEWVLNPEVYPYYVAESQAFEAELRSQGYDVGALREGRKSAS